MDILKAVTATCALLSAVGCAGDKGAPTKPGSGSGGASTAGLDATTPLVEAGDFATCQDAGGAPADAGLVCILHVSGRAIDQNGAPVAAQSLVSACGPAQCNPGITDAGGHFRIGVGLDIVPDVYSVQVHLRPNFAAFYYRLPEVPGPYIDIGNVRVLPMPASGPSLVIDRAGSAAQSVTSGDVTLEVPASTYVRLDVEANLAGALGTQFRALRIPDAFLPEYAPPSTGIRVLYAMEPFEASFEVGGQPNVLTNARLSFVNYAKFAAGSSVDLMALGSYVFPEWIPPATFQKVATGHVSTDGNTIELDPDQGLPYLTWVGLRSTP